MSNSFDGSKYFDGSELDAILKKLKNFLEYGLPAENHSFYRLVKMSCLNRKLYSTVGLLYPHSSIKHQKGSDARMVSLVDECGSLSSIAGKMNEYSNTIKTLKELSSLSLQYVNVYMDPTCQDINDMLVICHILLENELLEEYSDFIYSCPDKFLLTYTNNSEQSLDRFCAIKKLGLKKVCSYLARFVHYSKINKWNERLGHSRFEDTYM